MIYLAFVHAYVTYGIDVYCNTAANCLSKFIVLNNELLRMLKHKPIKTQLWII